MKLNVLIALTLSTSVFAFEPPKDQVCVEVQRECQPDVRDIEDGTWYLSADCSVRVVKQSRYSVGGNIVTDMKPEPKYECHPKKEIKQ